MAKLKSCDRDHRAGDGNYLSVSGHFQGGKMAKPCYKPRAHNHFVNNFYDMVQKLNVAVNDSCVCVRVRACGCMCVCMSVCMHPHSSWVDVSRLDHSVFRRLSIAGKHRKLKPSICKPWTNRSAPLVLSLFAGTGGGASAAFTGPLCRVHEIVSSLL